MTTSEIATVLAWHDALNASDIDTLMALSSDDVEVGDAHGAAQGHAALRDWAAARPRKAEVGRIYVHDGVVVVEPSQIATRGARGTTSITARGLRTLYVALTRPTRRLAVIASGELPPTLQ